MKRIQKIAMFMFAALTFALIVSAVAVAIIYTKYGFPKALAGLGFMGIAGIGGLAQLFFKKDPEKVEYDERDQYIQSRAALAGFATAYLVVGIATIGPFIILGPNEPITTNWLPLIFVAAGITHFYVWSIAILAQYGWRK
ncbi:MAG: hypothetical protein KAQ89_05870 [Planctomycetes bacterium]|nr:hypothetical protein [Planctomycetota bacterium]